MSKILLIGDTHLGLGYPNSVDKWFKTHKEYFDNFLLPLIKTELNENDIIVHLGDLFDNRTIIPINILNYAQKILEEISDVCPIHIIVGNHDLYNKSTNEVNTVKIFKYIPNVHVYEEPTKITFNEKSILLLPWVTKKKDQVKILKEYSGCDYLFCHSDLNGAKMHLTSVAHKNKDKIDVEEFSGYKSVYSGHIHLTQVNKNFTFAGSIFQMDRNDLGNQKGIFILDTLDDSETFIENKVSPIFQKVYVRDEKDIDVLDGLVTKNYVDLFISNSLLINNRKLRRKLESILERGNFAKVEYIDDILNENKNEGDVDLVKLDLKNEITPTMKMEYTDYIKEYIDNLTYDSDNIKEGIINEFEEIVVVYNDNFKEIN